MAVKLSPSQQEAFDDLTRVIPIGNVIMLWSDRGMGRTTVLRELHHVLGGAFLNMRDFVDAMYERHPLALEETFDRLVMNALQTHQAVIVDDLHLLTDIVGGCGAYPRSNFLDAPLTVLVTYAEEAGKKLIFGSDAQGLRLSESEVSPTVSKSSMSRITGSCVTFTWARPSPASSITRRFIASLLISTRTS